MVPNQRMTRLPRSCRTTGDVPSATGSIRNNAAPPYSTCFVLHSQPVGIDRSRGPAIGSVASQKSPTPTAQHVPG